MGEFIDVAFSGSNAIATGLFLLVLVYWFIVMFGFIGTDFLDFDIDIDTDTDVDTDVETSVAGISWINHILIFFNLSKVPLMIWLSFLSLPLWIMTVIGNSALGFSNFFMGLIVLIPAFIISLFIAKFLTWPFVSVFEKIEEESKEKEILGRVGKVVLSASHESKGQAEINYNGSFLSFYILTEEGIEVVKGNEVMFIKPIDESTFLVEPHYEIK